MPNLKSSLLKPALHKSLPKSSSSSSRKLAAKKKAPKKSKTVKQGDIRFVSSSDSEEDKYFDSEVYTEKTPEKETDPVQVDLEERGHTLTSSLFPMTVVDCGVLSFSLYSSYKSHKEIRN